MSISWIGLFTFHYSLKFTHELFRIHFFVMKIHLNHRKTQHKKFNRTKYFFSLLISLVRIFLHWLHLIWDLFRQIKYSNQTKKFYHIWISNVSKQHPSRIFSFRMNQLVEWLIQTRFIHWYVSRRSWHYLALHMISYDRKEYEKKTVFT